MRLLINLIGWVVVVLGFSFFAFALAYVVSGLGATPGTWAAVILLICLWSMLDRNRPGDG